MRTTIPVRVDLGVMAMKGYSKLLRFPEMDLKHQMQFSFLLQTLHFSDLTPRQKVRSEYSMSSRQIVGQTNFLNLGTVSSLEEKLCSA